MYKVIRVESMSKVIRVESISEVIRVENVSKVIRVESISKVIRVESISKVIRVVSISKVIRVESISKVIRVESMSKVYTLTRFPFNNECYPSVPAAPEALQVVTMIPMILSPKILVAVTQVIPENYMVEEDEGVGTPDFLSEDLFHLPVKLWQNVLENIH